MNNAIQIWSTGTVLILCVIAALFVGPYAVRETLADPHKLRGWFALGLTVLFVGIAGRLGAAWLFYFTPEAQRADTLARLHPWILGFNLLIVLGAAQCIRLVTIKSHGEWAWIAALLASGACAALVL